MLIFWVKYLVLRSKSVKILVFQVKLYHNFGFLMKTWTFWVKDLVLRSKFVTILELDQNLPKCWFSDQNLSKFVFFRSKYIKSLVFWWKLWFLGQVFGFKVEIYHNFRVRSKLINLSVKICINLGFECTVVSKCWFSDQNVDISGQI